MKSTALAVLSSAAGEQSGLRLRGLYGIVATAGACSASTGSANAELPRWYAARDRHLADVIVGEIRSHPGCRIAVVTGADHHGPVVAAIATLPDETLIKPVP